MQMALRAVRAVRVFCTDMKHQYRKRGSGKNKESMGVL
jgi:hypothetical protein